MDTEEAYKMLKERKKVGGNPGKGKGISEEERRQKILLGLSRKKECESKALAIVERLIEPQVEQEFFRDAANYLHPGYYDDVVEERFCVSLCGFPLCATALKAVPKQQFCISAKENKVYDISERKKFCSDLCFKHSNYYKQQVPTIPLWLREKTDHVVIRFLHNDPATVDLTGKGTELQLAGISKTDLEAVDDNHSSEEIEPQTVNYDSKQDLEENLVKMTINQVVAVDKPTPPIKPILPQELSPLRHVESCVSEWFTIDTLRLLEGDEYVRQRLLESRCTVESVVSAVGDEAFAPEFRVRYIELCRQLDLKELEEETMPEDSEVACSSKEMEEERLKLSAYLEGKTEITMSPKREKSAVIERLHDEARPVLPLVDHYAQGALRRRLVHDQLDRVLPDILSLCGGLVRRDMSEYLRRLVLSFSFSSDNIVMRPHEWSLVAIVLVNMLAHMEPTLRETVRKESTRKCLNLVLLVYETTWDDVERFITWLSSDVRILIAKMQKM